MGRRNLLWILAILGLCQISGSMALAAADAAGTTSVDDLTVSVGLMASGIAFTFAFAWRLATWRGRLERKIDALRENQEALAKGQRANRRVVRVLLARSGLDDVFLPTLPKLRQLQEPAFGKMRGEVMDRESEEQDDGQEFEGEIISSSSGSVVDAQPGRHGDTD
jgi:hypothetical protein